MRPTPDGVRALLLAAVFLVVLSRPTRVSASTVVDLGNNGDHSLAQFINNEGDVVGKTYSTGTNYLGFFYSGTNPALGVQIISALGGSKTQPTGLNGVGEVSGFYTTSTAARHAFLYGDQTTYDLGTLGGLNSAGWGLNDSGTVVGNSLDGSGNLRPILVTEATSTTWNSPTNINPAGTLYTEADFINNNGQIAGNGNTLAIYSANGAPDSGIAIGLTNATTSRAFGINASGQVIGQSNLSGSGSTEHGFLYTPGPDPAVDLGTLIPDGSGGFIGASDAEALNDSGEVVGKSDVALAGQPLVDSGHHDAYLYTNATMTDLGLLNGTFTDSVADAINASGVVVGTDCVSSGCTTPTAGTAEAFIYINGQLIDLTTLLPDHSVFTDLLTATGINDGNVVIGQGMTVGGKIDGYILNVSADAPAPEPSTIGCITLGLVLFAVRLRLRRQLHHSAE